MQNLLRCLSYTLIFIAFSVGRGNSGDNSDPVILDLSDMVSILDETFESPLNRYDMVTGSGLWWTLGRRSVLMTNAEEAVFLDQGVLEGGDAGLPVLHAITPDGLALRSALLPETVLSQVRAYMQRTGQGARAADIRYGTARISTEHTWAQSYGYFEVEARIPRGRGRWPAFWLSHAGIGWPPEIDVFEAYGAGVRGKTAKDNTFSTSVFFDAFDTENNPVHRVDIVNDHDFRGRPAAPRVFQRVNRDVYSFGRSHDAQAEFGADIYSHFYVWGTLWTPEEIVFYFGPDRDSLREVYRTLTPDDVHVPQYIIANDQFTARGGWWSPRLRALDEVLDPDNAFVIRRIRVLALPPEQVFELQDQASAFDPGPSFIHDTPGDDVIAPGDGLDIITLSGGRDWIELSRGRHGTIISGFDADDRIIFEGDIITDGHDAFRRLTQVGSDVWLSNGGNGGWPQSVIFRDAMLADFSPDQFGARWPVSKDLFWADASHPRTRLKDIDEDGILHAPYEGAHLSDAGSAVRMYGNAGPDRYTVAHRDSTVVEAAEAGVDTIFARVSMDVPPHVEHVIATRRGIWLRGSPEGERLTAEADGVTLVGRGGDDLFVLEPGRNDVTLRIWPGDGHDWVRGFDPSLHRFDFQGLPARETWQVTAAASGARLWLSDKQSLLLEGVPPVQARAAFGLAP